VPPRPAPEKISTPNGEHPYGDLGQLLLLVLFLIIWVADSFFLHYSTGLAAYVSLPLRLLIAALALATALLLFKSGHVVISDGKHGQLPISLLRTGGFRYVRHPLYLGCLLVYLGLGVATASLFSLVFLAVVIGPFYNFIATYEENLLASLFGESYLAYRQQTGKWLPKLRKALARRG
jgi:protein-S-isoprenylcysteine O-methyltransferase Ste14